MAIRRANGSGSITNMKGRNRRKPYRVRITTGWEVDEETGKVKQIIRDLGCYATQNEARDALQAYLGCPYDLAASQMTFVELYTMWFEEYQESLDGISSRRTIESAWRYCSTLYNMRRYYEWYAICDNVLNDKSDYKIDKVFLGVATIFMMQFVTRGDAGLSSILRIYKDSDELLNDKNGEAKEWIKFLNTDFEYIISELHSKLKKNDKLLAKRRSASDSQRK